MKKLQFKKIRLCILTFIMYLFFFFPFVDDTFGCDSDVAYAKEDNLMELPINIEQAKGEAPYVKAYINGKKIDKSTSYKSIWIYGEDDKSVELTVNENEKVTAFGDTDEGIDYYILLDNSKSVNKSQFEEAKKQLAKFREDLKENDSMTLYLIGAKKSNGQKSKILETVEGKVTSKDKIKKDIKTIKNIKLDMNSTILCKSIKEVVNLKAIHSKQRKVIIAITDAANDSDGKDNTTDAVKPYIGKDVPIFGIIMKDDLINEAGESSKVQDSISDIFEPTKGKGYVAYANSENAGKDAVKRGFDNIKKVIRKQTFVVNFVAVDNSNETVTNARLVIDTGKATAEIGGKNGGFIYNSGEKDENPPELKNITKVSDKSISFEIVDPEGREIIGAEEKKNYTVKRKGKSDIIEIESVKFENGKYVMYFTDNLYSDSYELVAKGIRDNSNESNEISNSVHEFTFKGKDEKAEAANKLIKDYWWILLIIVVILIGGIIAIIIKRKAAKVEKVEFDVNKLRESDTRR
nr:VWA domain-containing protein [Lachnospiraceae bacterium]